MKSMTGYCRIYKETEWGSIDIEMRSVNSRFLDLNIKQPRDLSPLEDIWRKLVSQKIKRGRVSLSLRLETLQKNSENLSCDLATLQQYVQQWQEIQRDLNLSGEITVQDVMLHSARLQSSEDSKCTLPPDLQRVIQEAVQEAVQAFDEMRTKEGQHLKEVFEQQRLALQNGLQKINTLWPQALQRHHRSLKERLSELLQEAVQEQVVLQEAAILAERMNVQEELDRFTSHLKQLKDLFEHSAAQAIQQPLGRKVEFILQEMHREINTLGVKVADFEISQHVVQAKCELEKMREQIQNVE